MKDSVQVLVHLLYTNARQELREFIDFLVSILFWNFTINLMETLIGELAFLGALLP